MRLHSFNVRCICISLVTCLAGIIGGNANAQSKMTPSPATVVKINPLSLVVATANVQMERRLGDRFSGQVGINLGAPALKIFAEYLPQPVRYRIFSLTPELRYFIAFQRRQVPRGPYVAAYLRFQKVRMRYGIVAYDPDIFQDVAAQAEARKLVIGGGFLLGYQFFFKQRVALDLFVGPKYSHASSRYDIQCNGCDGDERVPAKPGISFDGLDLRAGIGIGYGF